MKELSITASISVSHLKAGGLVVGCLHILLGVIYLSSRFIRKPKNQKRQILQMGILLTFNLGLNGIAISFKNLKWNAAWNLKT